MDAFVLIMAIVVGGLVLWILFLGLYHPRSGAEVLDWKPTRSAELEVQNEIDDVEQMLAAANERRRARGEQELTEGILRERIREDLAEANERSERYLDDADLGELLEANNARRRARGEPELDEQEYRARFEADRARLRPTAGD